MSESSVLENLPDPTTGVITRLAHQEAQSTVAATLEQLSPRDREVIILRGIEQHSYREIAAILQVDEKLLPTVYRRALEKLRKQLPGSVYEEFVDA